MSAADAPRLAWQDAPPTADNLDEVWILRKICYRGRADGLCGRVMQDADGVFLYARGCPRAVKRTKSQWARLPLPEGAS